MFNIVLSLVFVNLYKILNMPENNEAKDRFLKRKQTLADLEEKIFDILYTSNGTTAGGNKIMELLRDYDIFPKGKK